MIEVTAPADGDHLSVELARLRRAYAEADVDPHSTLERIPTARELSAAFRDADAALVAHADTGDVVGYGLVWSCVEDDGTSVQLLDAWAAPGPVRTTAEEELFARLETSVRDRVGSSNAAVVLGANCRAAETTRSALLTRLGFRPVFAMVEMELATAARDRSRPSPPVALRTARPDDASAVAALTERVWAGRPYFTSPPLEDVQRWLSHADPELFLLAEDGSDLVGLVSAKITTRHAEIDDVQVDPGRQRQGIATHLLTELVGRLRDRTTRPIRLHTEEHDPAGARSLYERLGFTVVDTHRRYRKRLG